MILVLDAMGVIYSIGDDVIDLLCPFIEEKGGTRNISTIEECYHSASLGNMSASEFWEAVELDPGVEDEYLFRHELTDGLIAFLETINSSGIEVWCLSNDLSEWSRKLRVRFELENYIRGFIISGDVGVRKPDKAIFNQLVRQLDTNPRDIVFVDDQPRNLDSAAVFGLDTILFTSAPHDSTRGKHRVVMSFRELLSLLCK